MAVDSTPPVYLFTVDSLRADFFSESYFPETWRYFDEDFLRFSNAFANGIATPLAFPSILSDEIVTGSGVLSSTATTLAERLPDPSVALPNNVHLSPERGYGRGFSQFDIELGIQDGFDRLLSVRCFRRNVLNHIRQRLPLLGEPSVPILYRPAERMVYEIKRSVNRTAPAFLWGHFMDPHGPYHPSLVFDRKVSVSFDDFESVHDRWKRDATIREDALAKLTEVYEEKIRYLDRQLVQLFEWLERNEHYEDALILFTADHGQLIGESGRFGHDWDNVPVDELVRVPLLVKYPDGSFAGEVRSHHVQHLDLHATVSEQVQTSIDVNPESVPVIDASERYVIAKSNSAVRGISDAGDLVVRSDGSVTTTGNPPQDLRDRVKAMEPARVSTDVGQDAMTEAERRKVNEQLKELGYV